MKRRGFLTGMAGILAAGSAPAIIHNPMKIFVRKPDIRFNNLCQEVIDPWGINDEQMAGALRNQRMFLESGQVNVYHDTAYSDQRLMESPRRRKQVIDTSMGFQFYEIPLHPVDPKTWKPIPVPNGPRIHRFS